MSNRIKINRFFQCLVAVYVINRISYFAHEIFKSFIFYNFKTYYLEISTNHIENYSDIEDIILYLVPLNPYFIIGWSPIIVLNIIIVVLQCRMLGKEDNFAIVKNYFYTVLVLYILTMILFAVMSGVNNYGEYVICDSCVLEILLNYYAPYAPELICGFVFGNIISCLVFIFIRTMVRYAFKLPAPRNS
jgi:hypothetical protein